MSKKLPQKAVLVIFAVIFTVGLVYFFRYTPVHVPSVGVGPGSVYVWDRLSHRVCVTGYLRPISCASTDLAQWGPTPSNQ